MRKWRREGTPKEGFRYLRGDGKPLRDATALSRIERLAIPPAWTGVEIAPRADEKIQATGHDAAGRKQYVYHDGFVRRRARSKFRRVEAFARGS
jgi:DNA topoisomerase-1